MKIFKDGLFWLALVWGGFASRDELATGADSFTLTAFAFSGLIYAAILYAVMYSVRAAWRSMEKKKSPRAEKSPEAPEKASP